MLIDIRRVAKRCGYAIGVHGSMTRDFDLIAVPWTEEATDDYTLIEEIRKKLKAFVGAGGCATKKPHGRRAWVICLDAESRAYLDISVIPRRMSRKNAGKGI